MARQQKNEKSAEYVVVDARVIAHKPEGVSHTIAAALPMPMARPEALLADR